MAFEITWDEVKLTAKNIAVDLEKFTTEARNMILAEANCEVPEVYGDGWTQILRRYWAAHIATQSTLESAGEGAIVSAVIGSISSAKNQPVNNPSAEQYWGETHYGRAYFNYIQKFKERNIVAFGTFGSGQLKGFQKNIPEC